MNTPFNGNNGLSLENAGVTTTSNSGAADVPSFRNAAPVPVINSSISSSGPPTLPPRPELPMAQNYGMNQMSPYGMGSYGMGGMGSYGMSGMGSYGMGGMGSYGMGGMGSYGMGMGSYGMGGMGGYGYNNMGSPMYGAGDIESRFIHLAEENTRPTFDSIQSLVHAVGSIAMMMENTFFALTSSFRAILGVAENFGRLRSLFAQFWSTFAVVRTFNWLIRKLMVMLGIRTESEFKAWAEAVAASQSEAASPEQRARGSSWPVLLFFGVVAAAPYIVLRMFKGLTNSIHERLNDPATWQNPIRAIAHHDFQATSPQEISFHANQVLTIAPQSLQANLWNSGWLMASTDRQTAGLVPVTYIKLIKPNDGTNCNEGNANMVKEEQNVESAKQEL